MQIIEKKNIDFFFDLLIIIINRVETNIIVGMMSMWKNLIVLTSSASVFV